MRSTSNIAWATASYVVVPLISLITQPLLAHGLGVDGRGQVAAATAPLLLVVSAFTLGLPEALTQFVARGAASRYLVARSLILLLVAGGLGTAAIIGLSNALASGNDSLQQLMILAAAFAAPALATAGLRGIVAGRSQWRWIAASRFVQAMLQMLAVTILYTADELTPLTGTIVIAAAQFIGGFVLLGALRAEREIRPGSSVSMISDKTLLMFGSRMWFGAIAGILIMRLDQVMIAPLSSVIELGYYVVAVSLSEVILVANSGIRDVVYTSESNERRPDRVAFATRVSTFMVTLLAIMIALPANWVVPALFGEGFSGAVPCLYVLLAAVAIGNVGSIPGMALAGWGRPGLRSISLAGGTLVNVLLVILLVPPHGAMGAAVATFGGNAAVAVLNVMWMRAMGRVSVQDLVILRRADLDRVRTLIAETNRRKRLRNHHVEL